jgi:hypothetical protein
MRHESEGAEAVVEVDEDRAMLGDVLAAVERHAAGPDGETAAVDVDQHR